MDAPHAWGGDTLAHPGYLPLRHLLDRLPPGRFPDCDDLTRLARDEGHSWLAFSSSIVAQSALDYERGVAATGVVPTRENNWHDCFNALCWIRFPKLKRALNALHLAHADNGERGLRGALRDRATLLDESGALMLCADPELAGLIDRLSPYVYSTHHYAKLILSYFLLENFELMSALYARMKAHAGSDAALGALQIAGGGDDGANRADSGLGGERSSKGSQSNSHRDDIGRRQIGDVFLAHVRCSPTAVHHVRPSRSTVVAEATFRHMIRPIRQRHQDFIFCTHGL